jgi:hypothetical protein
LEDEVNPELGVACKALICRLTKVAARQITNELRKVHAVEDVEKIRAEFELRERSTNLYAAWRRVGPPERARLSCINRKRTQLP